MAPTGPFGVQRLQGQFARSLVNLLNIVVFAITFKFVYFILTALVAKAIDIGQNDILIEDKRDDNLMWATSGVALTLEDVGLHNLRTQFERWHMVQEDKEQKESHQSS